MRGMSPADPNRSDLALRRLMGAGGALVVTLVALAALLPLWLRPPKEHERAGDPVSVQRSMGHDERAELRATPRPSPAEPVGIAVVGASQRPDAAAADAQRAPATNAATPTPLVNEERGTVQPPESPLTEGLEDEWDRSAEARDRGVTQFGGSAGTETAVENGLAWLAAHQSPNGAWDRINFDRRCPRGDRCTGAATQRGDQDLDAGVTGLALLAFLGAGYTDRAGPYADVVRAGVEALLARQQASGGFTRQAAAAGYNDALATLTLAEFHALTEDQRVRPALERAVAHIVAGQQTLGGWDYVPTGDTGRNDTSVTAWMVQALHACRGAGVDVPPAVFIKAALHFLRATETDGRVRYADSGEGFQIGADLRPVYLHSLPLTAAGLMCEQLLGWEFGGATPLRQRGRLHEELPSLSRLELRDASRRQSEYYWYYGSLAMFQRGEEDWRAWNSRLRDALLPLQSRETAPTGARKHSYGSWPPMPGNWDQVSQIGGRVYMTAICTLTLEIYYRHTPAYLRDDLPYGPEDWRAYLRTCPVREQREVVTCLAGLRVEVAEPVLVDLLIHADRHLALAAAEALTEMGSPVGLWVLEAERAAVPASRQPRWEWLHDRARALLELPAVEGRVRVFDAGSGLGTLDLPRSYVGMDIEVRREEALVARMRVIQRFAGRTIVVAEIVERMNGAEPQTGDAALAR